MSETPTQSLEEAEQPLSPRDPTAFDLRKIFESGDTLEIRFDLNALMVLINACTIGAWLVMQTGIWGTVTCDVLK